MKRLSVILLVVLTLAVAADVRGSSFDVIASHDVPLPLADEDFYDDGRPSPAKVELGRLLFFDKILSGNRNIACATCHHPDLGTSDRLALGLGEGPTGLGADRRPGRSLDTAVHERVPRNSPALFNLGAREHTVLFHDGRVELDTEGYYDGGFVTPAKWKLPKGLDNVLAAQAMFPVASPAEMAGQKGENPIADAVSLNNVAGPGGVWEQLGARLRAVPDYVARFEEAFPSRVNGPDDVTYVLAANAISAFESESFRADRTPFDAFLRGRRDALGPAAVRGMALFYGEAGCSSCHSGKLLTDHDFHAIAVPQIGPGKADGRDADYWSETGLKAFVEDFGRGRVTVRDEDNFKFRTPSLRNVALTGPWGHDGAFDSLEAVVRHHLDPVASLEAYALPDDLLVELTAVAETTASGSSLSHGWMSRSRYEGFLERDDWALRDEEIRSRIANANELGPRDLDDDEVADLVSFLESLTDPTSARLAELIPDVVPSGLAVDD